ncbi:MAG: hypothetical protein IGS03_01925 [Candidatus Sericytochromatia bacterium]|nr:hypothetical protein [Candidatus Sericytochromatia bacterium]
MSRPALVLSALCFVWGVLAQPALAYQAQVQQPNVSLRSMPDLRHGKELQRLTPQRAEVLNCIYASDSSVWCLIRPASGGPGWVQARFLDPALKANFPLRLSDLPALLLFEAAHNQLRHQKAGSAQSARVLLTLDMALMKQRWESMRHRLNFLEISRRARVPVSETEIQQVQAEIKVLEQRFQQVLAEWLRLPG